MDEDRARRSSPVAGGRPAVHRVRCSPEEEARLLVLAGHPSAIPRLLRESALAGLETPMARRAAMAELFAVRHDLAGLVVAGVAPTMSEDLRALMLRIDEAIDGLSLAGVAA